jgi:hypothetical protein
MTELRPLCVKKDDPRHHEHEHREVHRHDDHFLGAMEKREVGTQAVEQRVGAQQQQDAQGTRTLADDGREERGDGGEVGPGGRARELAAEPRADGVPEQEVDGRRRPIRTSTPSP